MHSLSRRSGQIRDYLAQLGAGLPEEPSDISSLSCLFPLERKGGAARADHLSRDPVQTRVCFSNMLTFSTLACQITSSLSNCVRGSS